MTQTKPSATTRRTAPTPPPLPRIVNRTDSPLIESVETHAKPDHDRLTDYGTTQHYHTVVTDITLSSDSYSGQIIDKNGRRVIRLIDARDERSIPKLLPNGNIHSCIECGADTTPPPQDVRSHKNHYEIELRLLEDRFEAFLKRHAEQLSQDAQEILEAYDPQYMVVTHFEMGYQKIE